MSKWTERDKKFMKRALEIARNGEGFVEPNPMVGCVIAKSDHLIAEGYHRRFGHSHAEANALRAAGFNAKRATCFVTLEPCSHHGKTPPCADALIAAGVRRVVIGARDPNPVVSGRGIRKLRKAGIQVDVGLLASEAKHLIAPFMTFHLRSRPYVILKWAQSIDGKIATRSGDSKWITSAASRRQGHRLRARVDAIVVGVGTILADNPDLTARFARPRRLATRVILDSSLRTPLRSKVVRTSKKVPTLIVGTDRASTRRSKALSTAGCEVLVLPSKNGRVSIPRLLKELHDREVTNVMVEGGGKVLGAFWDEEAADAAQIFVAPRIIGGEGARSPLSGYGPDRMVDLARIGRSEISGCGPDIWYNLVFRQ